jgi:membrane associated rhomboid family serine protease
MTPTSVGMRCPECARQRTQVHTLSSMAHEPVVTYVLLAVNVAAFLGSSLAGGGLLNRPGGDVIARGALFGPAIADQHEYWRLITGGFLHANLLHIGFNMYLLYLLGRMIEPAIGPVRFAALYLASLLAGSFGALVVTPDSLTVGASGAVFGLMGAAAVMMRARGIGVMDSGIGGLIVLNLAFSFIFSGISVGGHIGGLLGGLLAAAALEAGMQRRSQIAGLVGCVAVAAVSAAGGIAAAGSAGLG